MRTKLVGSMLYFASLADEASQGYKDTSLGANCSGTGPTTSEGQIMDSAFSRCKVSNLVAPVCKDSTEEYEDATLAEGPACRGDAG